MIASQLSVALKPFRPLISRNALSSAYRSLELSANAVRGCATFAVLEVVVKLPLKEPIYVDTQQWLAVIDSLPGDEELHLKVEKGVLEWRAGNANGRLALVAVENMPTVSYRFTKNGWATSDDFKTALELGSTACASSALTAVGMYGVVLDSRHEGKQRDSLTVFSSDNTAIAACKFKPPLPASAPDVITLPADGVDLLCGVISKSGTLEFDEQTVYYHDEKYRLAVRQIAPLQNDIREVYSKYTGGKKRIALPQDRIAAFVKRALGLMTARQIVYVDMGVRQGKLLLSFEESSASSQEFYALVDSLKMPDVKDIKLNALKLARALSHTQEAVLDFLARDVIILEGKTPEFHYCIAGFG